jgi:Large eukaryotic DNA virus major capsid protein/Major capsid protein N-terminus
MSAGYIQLAALGQQDALLTGEPSLTYFQGLYSRNTPFVLEAYDITFNGTQQAFGTQQICKIPFKGDIVRGLTLKTNMPYLNNPGNDWNWSNIASESGFIPKITIDNKFFRAPTTGITYYSTNLQSQFQLTLGWMNNPASVPFVVSSTVAPVTGTSITIPFYTGNVLPNFNMYPGYIGTTGGVVGNMTVSSYTTTSITFTISSQTTSSIPAGNVVYITGTTLQSNVIYDSNVNKFAFRSYSNISVEPGLATFWGLDPKNFDNILPDGNLNYIVSKTSSHLQVPFAGLTVAYGDFTLEQGGWTRGNGLPSAAKNAGIFFKVEQPVIPSTNGSTPFRIVTRTGDLTPNYVFLDFSKYLYISQVAGSTFCFQSVLGSIGFTRAGQYCIRGSFYTSGTDATYSIGYGFSTTDGHPGTATFVTEHVFTLTASQPTPLFSIPVSVTLPPGVSTIFMYIDIRMLPVNAILQPGSWISVGPVDQYFSTSTALTTGTQIAFQNFTSYPAVGGGSLLSVNSSANSITFSQTGTWLMTAVLALQNSTVTSVSVSSGTRGANAYTYTTYQGQYGYPSLDFMIPISVQYTTLPYFVDITMQSLTGTVTSDQIMGSNVSYFQFIQNTAVSPTSSFPQNGLMFTPSLPSFVLQSPIDFSAASWTKTGGTTQIAVSGSQVAIYVGGLYYLQAVLCTSDVLKSVTVTVSGASTVSATHVVSVGLLPPYTIGIPFYIPNATTIQPALASISYTTSIGTSTTAYANTFFSFGILASNLVPVYTYVDSVATYMIDSAELRIGGQVIQSLSGEQIELYNDLYIPYENQAGLKLLTGKQDTSNVFDPGRTYYTNLPFYFYGNTELSIPVCALGRSDLEVAVTLKPFSNLSFVSNLSSINQSVSMTMIVEYGFLSESEVKWMNKSRLDYLITQTQSAQFNLVPGFSTGVFRLPFLNPVRELYIVIQNAGQAPYDYSNNGLTNIGLQFNGQDFLSRQVVDAQYLQYVQTFQKYNVTPTRQFYVYSFANDPMNPRPTGQINLSRIQDVLLDLTVTPLANTARFLRIYALSYNVLRIENGIAGLLYNFSQLR